MDIFVSFTAFNLDVSVLPNKFTAELLVARSELLFNPKEVAIEANVVDLVLRFNEVDVGKLWEGKSVDDKVLFTVFNEFDVGIDAEFKVDDVDVNGFGAIACILVFKDDKLAVLFWFGMLILLGISPKIAFAEPII